MTPTILPSIPFVLQAILTLTLTAFDPYAISKSNPDPNWKVAARVTRLRVQQGIDDRTRVEKEVLWEIYPRIASQVTHTNTHARACR